MLAGTSSLLMSVDDPLGKKLNRERVLERPGMVESLGSLVPRSWIT
jgi:hypothetical protein